jgi:two-component system response regulator
MDPKNSMEPVHVLLVEDDAADAMLTREALSQQKLRISIEVAKDGIEALAYLRREGEFANTVRPDVILLDLNMPRMDGREFLSEIKSDEDLKMIPVVILTTSDADADIVKSYELQAACYLTKPVGFPQFSQLVQSISEFWFTVVKLPPDVA